MDLRGGAEVKIKLFQNMVMLHIKFGHRYTLDPGVGSKGQTIYFSESSHVAYQIRGN